MTARVYANITTVQQQVMKLNWSDVMATVVAGLILFGAGRALEHKAEIVAALNEQVSLPLWLILVVVLYLLLLLVSASRTRSALRAARAKDNDSSDDV